MGHKAILAAALLLSACATPGEQLAAGETAIPFVSSTGVIEWRVLGDSALYVRGSNNQWYLVRTMGACPRLRTATSLGFVTAGLDQLDRHGAILAQGWRCAVQSVVRSGEPPAEARG